MQWWARNYGLGWHSQGVFILAIYLAFATLIFIAGLAIRRALRSTPIE